MKSGRCLFLKAWESWDLTIHEEQAQITRQGRAMNYPFTFEIDKDSNSAIFSSSTDIPFYKTTLDSCICYDFQERELPCKHMYRLAIELGIIEIFNRPPGGYNKEALDQIKSSDDIDSNPDQLKRQKSSLKCKPVEIDYKNKTGIFKGSGKNPYDTTLDSCTCRDFFVRRLPCKHIYRLRFELDKEIE